MARRVSLPAADDLFRRTAEGSESDDEAAREAASETGRESAGDDRDETAPRRGREPNGGPSGRVRHDEKMTIYVTAAELLEIEHARLSLRGMHGLAVDRGRLVREAIAMALVDLDRHGDESLLVQRLTGR